MMHTKETLVLKMLNDLDTLLYLLFKKIDEAGKLYFQ